MVLDLQPKLWSFYQPERKYGEWKRSGFTKRHKRGQEACRGNPFLRMSGKSLLRKTYWPLGPSEPLTLWPSALSSEMLTRRFHEDCVSHRLGENLVRRFWSAEWGQHCLCMAMLKHRVIQPKPKAIHVETSTTRKRTEARPVWQQQW